jgi:hypothetical protein
VTCACCETGRCCNGATCTSATESQCAFTSGTFTSGDDCGTKVCLSGPPYDKPCTLTNACACAAAGKSTVSMETPTCNCATLTSLGIPYGGCQAYYCNACVAGTCTLTCQPPRQCCAGTCCPESQSCFNAGGYCVNKCNSPNTYCNTTGSGAYSYACCTSAQKCCGPSGCTSYGSSSGSYVGVSDKDPGSGTGGWYDTGVDLSASDAVTILGSGTFPEGNQQGLTLDGDPGTTNDSNRFSASFKFMALIGKVGAGGTPFLVCASCQSGTSYTGSPGAGRLYLRPNRLTYTFGSSTGGPYTVSWSVRIDPCPGYTPASVGEPVVYAAGGKLPEPGPGAALKSLLSAAGITSSPMCSCNARAAQMDAWGELESLKRLPEICGWLKEEAEKRGMWFFRPAGYALVLAAVLWSALKRLLRGNNK